jgi:hypothetical protein
MAASIGLQYGAIRSRMAAIRCSSLDPFLTGENFMAKEHELRVLAMLGAHERLISDLLKEQLRQKSRLLDEVESYMEKMRKQIMFASVPDVNPVQVDQLNQMISEAIERTLTVLRDEAKEELRREHEQKNT